ncbi:lamin tail domain-containing protein [Chryseobacterium salivictor]|uniref:LTD domain-containing protein n=1 Tax=Chryseobacterium salivictor TaxID=2547600 RepID=A0A4P6ZJE1_9FLAO|nr:lamin tail domain-containing protein [Chryseobacterium salivictor]QBO59515.1 hypothetical protein NBC122_02714 [Chryseobacterium salivictor]
MRLKFIFFVVVFATFNKFSAQIVITEVYYDTPYNEKLLFGNANEGFVEANKHHRGEFVEIYNYSDKDISLKNWYLKDLLGVFWFPDKLIKSGQFMVVAYSTLPNNTTPFTEYFATTVGKGDQIMLQNKIILRNKREIITLGYKIQENIMLKKSSIGWHFPQPERSNFVRDIWKYPSNFYDTKSIQYHPNYPQYQDNPHLYNNYTDNPNPLDATYKPAIENYENIVKEDYQQYYSFLDWSENVKELVEKICAISIGKVEQTPAGNYTNIGKCFNYDSVGNETSAYNCAPNTGTNTASGYTPDELSIISNDIVIFPNPTTASNQYNVTISWSGVALNKIYNLQVYSSAGMSVYNYNPTTGVNTTTFNLQSQLPGTFVANFVLNTGQVVSKNILKW